jgi:hypothetical protein
MSTGLIPIKWAAKSKATTFQSSGTLKKAMPQQMMKKRDR